MLKNNNLGEGGQLEANTAPQARATIDNVKVFCAFDEVLNISELKPNPQNPNKHPSEQVNLLAEVIEKTGWRAPITISLLSGYIVKGHGRLEAAKIAGFEQVPVEYQSFNSESEEHAALIADNKIAELSEVDSKALAEIFESFNFEDYGELTGYSSDEYEELLYSIEEHEENIDPDIVIEPPKVAFTKPGDIYILGRHRLICGDSRVSDIYTRLLNGEVADMVMTDPPYNVDYEGKTKDKLKIKNDNKSDDEFHNFLLSCFTPMADSLRPGGSVYCWHADSERINFQTTLESAGILIKQNLIWNKNTMVLGRQDYHWQHEPCLYGWKDGAAHYFIDDRTQTTVINCNKPTKSEIHPTMKPVELFTKYIENSSKHGQIVLDPFGGSGTTIMACETIGRKARLIELEPTFCDSIVQRYISVHGSSDIKCIRNNEIINHPFNK